MTVPGPFPLAHIDGSARQGTRVAVCLPGSLRHTYL